MYKIIFLLINVIVIAGALFVIKKQFKKILMSKSELYETIQLLHKNKNREIN